MLQFNSDPKLVHKQIMENIYAHCFWFAVPMSWGLYAQIRENVYAHNFQFACSNRGGVLHLQNFYDLDGNIVATEYQHGCHFTFRSSRLLSFFKFLIISSGSFALLYKPSKISDSSSVSRLTPCTNS